MGDLSTSDMSDRRDIPIRIGLQPERALLATVICLE